MKTTSSRFISHPDGPSNTLNVDEVWITLVREIERVQRETVQKPDPKTLLSTYVGLGGTLMMSRLVTSFSELGPPHDTIGRSTLSYAMSVTNIEQMVRILYGALQASDWYPQTGSKVSFLETPVGISTVILLYLIEAGNGMKLDARTIEGRKLESWEVCAEILHSGVEVVARESRETPDVDDGCEILYGRAGLLYALLRLRASVYRCVPRPREDDKDGRSRKLWHLISDEILGIVINSIIERGRLGARSLAEDVAGGNPGNPSPLMWSWHQKRYIGAAHGTAGILHILLMCPTQLVSPYVSEILGTIEWLIRQQDQDGNWPSSLKPKDHEGSENDLVQWCHGAPGMLFLYSTLIRRCHTHPTIFRLTPNLASSLIASLHNAEVLVYTRGFLRKGVGLCHGVSGSVYALLAASDAIALLRPNSNQHQQLQIDRYDEFSRAYFLHAVHLAHLATSYRELESQREMKTPDRPWSLYEGSAGMCCAWAEVYDRLSTTGRNLSSSGDEPEGTRLHWARSRSGMPGFDDMIID